jgi:ribosomal RNA-processing protein 8
MLQVFSFDLVARNERITACDIAHVGVQTHTHRAIHVHVRKVGIRIYIHAHSKPHPPTSQVPLDDESVDVAVFCLSLMGTDMMQFVREGVRVLRPGGVMKVWGEGVWVCGCVSSW